MRAYSIFLSSLLSGICSGVSQRRCSGRKLTAFFLIITFLSTNISSTGFAQFPKGALRTSDSHSLAIQPRAMAVLGLPSELGTIEERFQGNQERVVLLIQDAHSAGEAQKSMRQILEFYEKQGVRLIAVEGAAGKMDTELFRAYPDREKLKEAFDFYLGNGELSGAAVNAVLSPFESDYYGIEDKKLYEEGVALFREALAQQPERLAGLSNAKAERQARKEKNYSPKLLELDSKLNALEKNKLDLPAFLEYLASVILRAKPEESPNRSFASLRMTHSHFPHLADYFSEIKPTAHDFGPEIEKAVNVILRAQPEGSPSKILRYAQDDKKAFQEKLQAYKTEQISPQAFAHVLLEAAGKAGVTLNFSKELTEALSRYGRLNQIKGSEFFEELEDYISEIKQGLFRNDAERKIDADDRRLRLTERLINLKLTRKEWTEIEQSQVTRHKSQENKKIAVSEDAMRPHLAFYRNAEAREAVFHQKLLGLMDKHKTQAAAFVAGGFHSSGMARFLKEADISYILISPAIKELPEEGLYSQHMRGEVSWKKYFKVKDGRIDLFESFTRAAVDRLLNASVILRPKAEESREIFRYAQDDNKSSLQLIRPWRDQLIRNLAVKEKTGKAGRYTRFLDEAAVHFMDPAKKEALRKEWLAKVDQFISGLRALKDKNQLTAQNMINLTANPAVKVAAQHPFANGVFVPGSFYFINPPAPKSELRSESSEETDDRIVIQAATQLAEAYREIEPDDTKMGKKRYNLYSELSYISNLADDESLFYKPEKVIEIILRSNLPKIKQALNLATRQGADLENHRRAYNQLYTAFQRLERKYRSEARVELTRSLLNDLLARDLTLSESGEKLTGGLRSNFRLKIQGFPKTGKAPEKFTMMLKLKSRALSAGSMQGMKALMAVMAFQNLMNRELEGQYGLTVHHPQISSNDADNKKLVTEGIQIAFAYRPYPEADADWRGLPDDFSGKMRKFEMELQQILGRDFSFGFDGIQKNPTVLNQALRLFEMAPSLTGFFRAFKKLHGDLAIPSPLKDRSYLRLIKAYTEGVELPLSRQPLTSLLFINASDEDFFYTLRRWGPTEYIPTLFPAWPLENGVLVVNLDYDPQTIRTFISDVADPSRSEARGTEARKFTGGNDAFYAGPRERKSGLPASEIRQTELSSQPSLAPSLLDFSGISKQPNINTPASTMQRAIFQGELIATNLSEVSEAGTKMVKILRNAWPTALRFSKPNKVFIVADNLYYLYKIVNNSFLSAGRSEARTELKSLLGSFSHKLEQAEAARVEARPEDFDSLSKFSKYVREAMHIFFDIQKRLEKLDDEDEERYVQYALRAYGLFNESMKLDIAYWLTTADKTSSLKDIQRSLDAVRKHRERIVPFISIVVPELLQTDFEARLIQLDQIEQQLNAYYQDELEAEQTERLKNIRRIFGFSIGLLAVSVIPGILGILFPISMPLFFSIAASPFIFSVISISGSIGSGFQWIHSTKSAFSEDAAETSSVRIRDIFKLLIGPWIRFSQPFIELNKIEIKNIVLSVSWNPVSNQYQITLKAENNLKSISVPKLHEAVPLWEKAKSLVEQSSDIETIQASLIEQIRNARSEARAMGHQDFTALSQKFRSRSFSSEERTFQTLVMRAQDHYSVDRFKEAKEILQNLQSQIEKLTPKHAARAGLPDITKMMAGLGELQRLKEEKAKQAPPPKIDVAIKKPLPPEHTPDPKLTELQKLISLEKGIFILPTKKPAPKKEPEKPKAGMPEKLESEMTAKERMAARKASAEEAAAQIKLKVPEPKPRDPALDAITILDEALLLADPQAIAVKLAELRQLPFNTHSTRGAEVFKQTRELHDEYINKAMEQKAKATAQEKAPAPAQAPVAEISFQQLFDLVSEHLNTFEATSEGQALRKDALHILERARNSQDPKVFNTALDLLRKPFALGSARTPQGKEARELLKRLHDQPAESLAPVAEQPVPAEEPAFKLTPEEKPLILQAVEYFLTDHINPQFNEHFQIEDFGKTLRVEITVLSPQTSDEPRTFRAQIIDQKGRTFAWDIVGGPAARRRLLVDKITPASDEEIQKINQEPLGFGPRIAAIYSVARSEVRSQAEDTESEFEKLTANAVLAQKALQRTLLNLTEAGSLAGMREAGPLSVIQQDLLKIYGRLFGAPVSLRTLSYDQLEKEQYVLIEIWKQLKLVKNPEGFIAAAKRFEAAYSSLGETLTHINAMLDLRWPEGGWSAPAAVSPGAQAANLFYKPGPELRDEVNLQYQELRDWSETHTRSIQIQVRYADMDKPEIAQKILGQLGLTDAKSITSDIGHIKLMSGKVYEIAWRTPESDLYENDNAGAAVVDWALKTWPQENVPFFQVRTLRDPSYEDEAYLLILGSKSSALPLDEALKKFLEPTLQEKIVDYGRSFYEKYFNLYFVSGLILVIAAALAFYFIYGFPERSLPPPPAKEKNLKEQDNRFKADPRSETRAISSAELRKELFENPIKGLSDLSREAKEALLSLIPQPFLEQFGISAVDSANLEWRVGFPQEKMLEEKFVIQIHKLDSPHLGINFFEPGNDESIGDIPLKDEGQNQLRITGGGFKDFPEAKAAYPDFSEPGFAKFDWWVARNLTGFAQKLGFETLRLQQASKPADLSKAGWQLDQTRKTNEWVRPVNAARSEVREKEKRISGEAVSLFAQKDTPAGLLQGLRKSQLLPRAFATLPSLAAETTSLLKIVPQTGKAHQGGIEERKPQTGRMQSKLQKQSSQNPSKFFRQHPGDWVQTLSLAPLGMGTSLLRNSSLVNKKMIIKEISPFRSEARGTGERPGPEARYAPSARAETRELTPINVFSVANSKNQNLGNFPIEYDAVIPNPETVAGGIRANHSFGKSQGIGLREVIFSFVEQLPLNVFGQFEKYPLGLAGKIIRDHYFRSDLRLTSLPATRPERREPSRDSRKAGLKASTSSWRSLSDPWSITIASVFPRRSTSLTMPFKEKGNFAAPARSNNTTVSSDNPLSNDTMILPPDTAKYNIADWRWRAAPLKPVAARSEAREEVGKSLLMGVHDFEPDAAVPHDPAKRHFYPDWWVMRVLGQELYDAQLARPGPVKLEDISSQVLKKLKGLGFSGARYDGLQLQVLLDRMDREYGLLEPSPDGGYKIAVNEKAFLIRVSHFKAIRGQLEKLLDSAFGQKIAEGRLETFLKEFSEAVKLWPRFPVESTWPVLRAMSTLSPENKKRLAQFLESPEYNALRKEPLIDSMRYILTEKISTSWLKDFAASLQGSTLYYISPETWLAAGGLGRVGQYHTLAAKLLMGSEASLVTIEPYYANRLVLKQNEKGDWEETIVKDVDYSKLSVPVQNLHSWKTFEVFVNKQGRRTPVQVEILRGTNEYGVEVFLYRDKPEKEGEDPYFTKLLYSYGQHGNAQVEEFTEFASKVSLKLSKKIEHEKKVKEAGKAPPTLWANDGQTALLPLFKLISDDLERMSPEDHERIKTDPTHEYHEYRDLIRENDEISLRDTSVLQTTHTYRNRVIKGPKEFIDGLRLPARYHGYLQSGEWIYLRDGEYQNAFDATSAGVRGAWAGLGGANGVAAIHAEEMNSLDQGVELNGITNGDDRKASRREFDAAFLEKYPGRDSENPAPEELVEAKKISKKRLSENKKLNELNPLFIEIDPEKMLISYSGRMVDEKIGDMRAFTEENIEALVRAGAQIVLMGNVQSGNDKSKNIYLKLKKIEARLAYEKKKAQGKGDNTFGLLIVASGWSIPEQRFLLAAADLQVNDSDRDPKRGTEAAGLTETNVLNAGGLEMSSPFLEAIFHQQGEVLDWEDSSSGNTIIPESEKPEDYRKAMLRALEEYQKDRLRFAQFQVTSLQFSKNLAAVPTAANYLRLIHKIRTSKKDADAMWDRFFQELGNSQFQSMAWFQDSQARLFSHLWENLSRNRSRDKAFFSADLFSRKDAEKIFDPDANRFGWWKDERHSFVMSDSGLAGMMETFRRLMQNQPRDLWGSLKYHAGRNDFFNYLNHALEGYSARIEPLRKKIRTLESQAAKTNNPDEKIRKNIEAMDLVDRYLQGLAAHLLNQYLIIPGKFLYPENSPSPLGAWFEKLFSNTLLSKMAAHYLDTRPQEAHHLYTTEKGFRAYWISSGGEAKPRILLLNTGAIAYLDKKNHGLKKAWGKIALKDHFRDWVENHLTSPGKAVQVYDPKKRVDYGLYTAQELEEGLKTGVPGIQLLGLRVKKSKALEIETPQTPFKNAMELFNALREPALLERDQLGEFLPRDHAIAEKKYSLERLPALMALVAGLTPQHLARVANWNPEVYGRLRQLSTKNALLFKKGTVAFHTGRDGSVVFSRSLEEPNLVFVVELDRSFFNSENKKTWFPVRDLGTADRTKPLFLDPSAIYRIHDRMRGGTNNPRAGINLLRHWDVGIPLEDITFGEKVIQHGWGFDVYQLERMQNLEPARIKTTGEKQQEPQDLQILEINTRGYFNEKGLKNFNDFTLKHLKEIRTAGYNTLWMMGVYEESPFSKEFNRYWGEKKKVEGGQHSSAFAIPGYTINTVFGGQKAFEVFADRAQKAGLRLMLDYIPNHFALDSPLIQEHPDWFVNMTTPPSDADQENRLENPTGYFPVELKDGRTIWVARATDGLSGPWGDTAQLNYLNPEVWKFMAEQLLDLAKLTRGGGVRVDSLQVLNPEVFRKLWVPYMQPGDFENHMQAISRLVFGREPHERNNIFGPLFAWIKEQYPDFKILGEVYHKQEGYWQGAGVDTTYAKYVYDWIVNDERDPKHPKKDGWQLFKDFVFRHGHHVQLDYLFRSLYFLENHDERVRILKVLGKRLGKSPEDPEVVAWSKLLAAVISTIPGSPLFYEGQEEGRSRQSTSANWVPDKPWLEAHPDTTIPGLKNFYKELLRQTADPVFRRGGFPEEIPHHGSNGGILAFVRRHADENGKTQAAVAVFNHSRDKVTLRLDLSLIGQEAREVTLEPWGYELTIEEDHNPPAKRSEARSEMDTLQSYFQKGDIENQGQTLGYEIRGVVLTPELLKNHLERLLQKITRMQAGEQQAAAAQILDHLLVLLQKKQAAMVPGILWEDAYFIGKAGKDSIMIANGLLTGPEPLLALASLFRLAALSWMQSRSMKPAEQESLLKGFFEAVFSSEEETRLKELHRQYVQLERQEYIQMTLDALGYFMPDSPFFKTDHLFDTWLDFSLKDKRLTMIEEAGFLMKKILPSVNTLKEFSKVPPIAEGKGAAHSNFVRSAYFKLILPMLAFSQYRYFFFKELDGVLKERDEIIKGMLRIGADLIYSKHPQSTDELTDVIKLTISQLTKGEIKLAPQEVRTVIFRRLYYAASAGDSKDDAIRQIRDSIYKDPKLLESFGYIFPPEQHRHLNLAEKPSPEAFKRRIENIIALYAKLLNSPNREIVERLFSENFYSKPALKQAAKTEYVIVPGFSKPVPEETIQEWINGFSGRMVDAAGANPLWMTHFSFYPQLAWAGLSRVSQEHSIGDYLMVYDTDSSPVGEMTQPYKLWPALYNDKQVILQRYEPLVWSDLFNWMGSKEDIGHPSTTTESLQQFLRVMLGVRKYYEKPAYDPADKQYQPYAPAGVDLAPVVKRVMDFNLQIDSSFWKTVKQYYQAKKNPEESWPHAFLGPDKTGQEEDEHHYENIRLWHYFLFTEPGGIFTWLASRLRTSGERLSADETRDLLDVIYALYWSGLPRVLRGQGMMFLFQQWVRHLEFYPDGVKVRDLEAFKSFLTEWQKPEYQGGSLAAYEKWKHDFYAKYPEAAEEKTNHEGEPIIPLEPVLPADPGDHPAYAQVQFSEPKKQNSFYSPENVLAGQFFDVAKHPEWKGVSLEDKEISINAIYENGGMDAPGQPFRYLFPGPQEGARLRALLVRQNVTIGEREQFVDFFSVTDRKEEEERHLYVNHPRIEALQPYGGWGENKSTLEGGSIQWQKVPDLRKIKVVDLSNGGEISGDGFFNVPVRQGLLKINRPAWKSPVFQVPDPLKAASVLVQSHGGKLIFYSSDAKKFLGMIELNDPRAIKSVDENAGIALMGPLAPLVRNFEVQSVKEYLAAQKISAVLEPLLKAGTGYDKLDFRDLPEGVLAQIEDKTFVLSKKWLENETLETPDGKKKAEETAKALLEEKDPLYQVRQSKKTLQEFWDKFFSNLDQAVPALPSVEDSFKGENFKEAERLRNKIVTAKKITAFYGQDSKIFKRLLASKTNKDRPYLQELMDLPPQEFWLRNPKGETYFSYAAVDFSRTPEAMGYLTPKNFQIREGAFEFKNTSGEDTTLYVFVMAEGKLRIFDSGTGAELDPKLSAALEFQETKKEFLASFPFKEEKSVVLRDFLEQYLKTFEGDAVSLPAIQKRAVEALANIPPLLDTVNVDEDWNFLLVQLIFERLKILGNSEQGLTQQKTELDRLKRKPGERHEDLNALQYLFVSAGLHDDFSLKSEAVQQFIQEALLSALQSEAMKGTTMDSFGYSRFFEYLGDDFENLSQQIQDVLQKQPNAVSEEDLNRWKESNTLGQKDAAISSLQRYFIRREFAAIHERQEAQRKAEEEARQKAVEEGQRKRAAQQAQKKEPKLNLEPAERERRRTHAELYGGDSIGASSIGFRHQNDFVIVDAGKRPNSGQGPKYRAFGQNGISKPSKIFLTHTHMDHAADLPRLVGLLDRKVDVYMTQGSFALLPVVLRGDLRESNRRKQNAGYTEDQLEELLKSPYLHVLKVGQWYALSKDAMVQYVGDEETGEAGHLLGAAPVVLATRYGNTGVLWDISVHDQGVVKGLKKWPANVPVHNIFAESTYAMRERPDEDAEEARMAEFAIERLRGGGKVLFPALANGRAQRDLFAMLRYFYRPLEELASPYRERAEKLRNENKDLLERLRIYLDGEAAPMTEIYQKFYPLLENRRHVKILDDVRNQTRMDILGGDAPAIIIASAGNGRGRAQTYIENMLLDPRDGIGFNSYQDDLEAGHKIIEIAKEKAPKGVEFAQVEQFKISGHLSGEQNIQLLERIDRVLRSPDDFRGNIKRVGVAHGDKRARHEVAGEIRKRHPRWHPELIRVDHPFKTAILGTVREQQEHEKWFDAIQAEAIPVYSPPEKAAKPPSFSLLEAPIEEPVPETIAEEPAFNAEKAKQDVLTAIGRSNTLLNVLRRTRFADISPDLDTNAYRWLKSLVDNGISSITDPKIPRDYSIPKKVQDVEIKEFLEKKLKGLQAAKTTAMLTQQPKQGGARSEVRIAARIVLSAIALNVPLAEADSERWFRQAKIDFDHFSRELKAGAREERYFNLYAASREFGAAGTAVNPGIYVEGLAASSQLPKDFFIRMEKENLEDLDLFLETIVTVGSFGHRITLAAPDRVMANEINGRLAQFFHKMDPAHMTELTEKIRAVHTPNGNALTASSEAGGRVDAIVPFSEAQTLLRQENLRKQLDRVIVSDQFKAGVQEVKVEKQGLLLKARLLLEAALTSKSTNALLQAGADLSLFFPNPNLASENLSAFLTGLNAAAQKVLASA